MINILLALPIGLSMAMAIVMFVERRPGLGWWCSIVAICGFIGLILSMWPH